MTPLIHRLPSRALGRTSKRLIFDARALETLYSERQLNPSQPESGGQLFGAFTGDAVHIITVTTPSRDDVRSRFRFSRLQATEQAEIDQAFTAGLHYLGDWHSHPEFKPTPSSIDVVSAKKLFRTSKSELRNFLMVIVGTSENVADLYIALVNGRRVRRLTPVERN
ncbi:MAG: Mov34/MPN/PAD-1 family protein [Hyphomonas sp.]|nr:Mov34/MPN/PAD-1 family protein [Hyphomonas sp.]